MCMHKGMEAWKRHFFAIIAAPAAAAAAVAIAPAVATAATVAQGCLK
jgi:hypothetical protein